MANKIPVAVIGAAGIGRIHIREFLAAGAEVVGILGSTPKSTKLRAEELSDEFNLKLRAFCNLEELINSGLKAVSICSPPETHLGILEQTLESNLYVFCEKPLFWQSNRSKSFVSKTLTNLIKKADGRLLVNTSNAWFMETYKSLTPNYKKPKKFHLKFYTNGPYRKEGIGLDLLPHGLSFLLEMGCKGKIDTLKVEAKHNEFMCQFNLDGVHSNFDFRENESCPKELSFVIDGIEVKRIQKFENREYSVFLACELFENGIQHVVDPFRIYIDRFLQTICEGGSFSSLEDNITRNVDLMTYILEPNNRNFE
jgi:hypothetical protein